MADLKQTLTELVKYLESVHKKALPIARPDASSTRHVIRWCSTTQEIGEKRLSADAHSVRACRLLGVENVGSRSVLIEGKLKQALIAARRGKRRGGNNAKWAQEVFGNIKRLGGIALRQEEVPVEEVASAPAVVVRKPAAAPAPAPVIDESQWGAGGAAVWDDEEEPQTAAASTAEVEDWESAW